VKRRELLRLTAAAAAGPLLPRGVALATSELAAPGRFFSAPEMTLLDELTETIIPADEHSGGARAAKVAAYIDGRLADYDPSFADLREEREAWKAGLAAIDALSRETTGKGFLEAGLEQRAAVITAASTGGPQAKSAAQRFFGELKEWTARGYYTSAVGIHDEMEYKGNTMLEEFSGTDAATLPKLGGA
jgi:Gluconate 2-dehydrogenase subunit 3